MDQGDSKLNPSSLIDLKAELHKKYETFRAAKLAKSNEPIKRTKFKSKLDVPKEKKEKHIQIVKPKEEIEEESLALKKSRLALEAKAKMYDKIVTNSILIDDERNENYLVDFQRKVLYSVPEPEKIEKTVNYTIDKASSSTSFQNVDYKYDTQDKFSNSSHQPNFEVSESDDQPIHYQNVQFNEVRDHGTGYFAFSQDHEKRKEQMEELNSLRQNTENHRASKQRLLGKRKAMLQSRLAKICERKNIDQSVLEAYKTNSEIEDIQEPAAPEASLSYIPFPEVKLEEEPKKKPKIRPWDEGKDNLQHFVPEKSKIRSQNDWIKEMREERRSEFAPPSTYLHNT